MVKLRFSLVRGVVASIYEICHLTKEYLLLKVSVYFGVMVGEET